MSKSQAGKPGRKKTGKPLPAGRHDKQSRAGLWLALFFAGVALTLALIYKTINSAPENPLKPVAEEHPDGQATASNRVRSTSGAAPARAGDPANPEMFTGGMAMTPEQEVAACLTAGNKLLQEGDAAAAVVQYERVLELNPRSEDAHFNLGIAFSRQGKNDEAIHHYREALRLMPGYAEAHNNLGNLLAKLGKLAEARQHFEAALKITPDYASALNNLGTLLIRENQHEQAAVYFERALKSMPEYVEARYNLANILMHLQRRQEAASEFREVLRLRPDFELAKKGLALAEGQSTNAP